MAGKSAAPDRRAATNPPGDEDVLVDDVKADEEAISTKYSITAYGADFTVDNIVARLNRGDIIIPTFDSHVPQEGSSVAGFQRKQVWRKPQRDRFIESLLLGFPVPGIFLVGEPNHTYLVLDGQQRLRTLQEYCNEDGSGPTLGSVHQDFSGKTYSDLFPTDRRRLDNSLIHATIVREDAPTEDKAGIYQIFERLNTGGTQLNPQEIRVALYGGDLMRLLSDLNRNEDWRLVYGLAESKRLKDQELILRSLAMYEDGESYRAPMKTFLSNYMSKNQNPPAGRLALLGSVFQKTVSEISTWIGQEAFRLQEGRLNAAVLESVFVGVAHRLDQTHLPTGRFEGSPRGTHRKPEVPGGCGHGNCPKDQRIDPTRPLQSSLRQSHMSQPADLARRRQKMDAAFHRANGLPAEELELRADFAR